MPWDKVLSDHDADVLGCGLLGQRLVNVSLRPTRLHLVFEFCEVEVEIKPSSRMRAGVVTHIKWRPCNHARTPPRMSQAHSTPQSQAPEEPNPIGEALMRAIRSMSRR